MTKLKNLIISLSCALPLLACSSLQDKFDDYDFDGVSDDFDERFDDYDFDDIDSFDDITDLWDDDDFRDRLDDFWDDLRDRD